MTIRAARARVEYLTITGSGLGLDIGPRAQADVVCNDISGNEETGVFVHRASQATLRDNMVTENGQRDLTPGDEDPTRFFECGLFVGDASAVNSFGNTYADHSYCGVAADRGGIFRNGSIVPHRQGFSPDPNETDIIVQRGCIPDNVSNCDASALGSFKHVAVETFNLGAVDLRNAEVTGLVDVSATSTFRMDTIGFLVGDISNLAAGNVRIRNRNLDNGRTVSFEGLLFCDANSGAFFSSVQCGQTCTGLDATGNLTCTP